MPLYEYYCTPCSRRFEEISSGDAPSTARCPRCQTDSHERTIARFAVGGRGDLRETTLHGCHEYNEHDDHSHHDHHDHGHSAEHDATD